MKIQSILSIILALALLSSCKSNNIIENSETGTLKGSVALYNIQGVSITSSGATTSIEGTVFKAISDSMGKWQINNIPAGVYNIITTKPGFDTNLTTQYQFIGAGTQFLEGQQGRVLQAIPFDSVPILSVIITDSVLHHDSEHQEYQYNGTLEFHISGPDSNTLQFFQWGVVNARTDTGTSLQLLNTSDKIPQSQPFTFTFSNNGYYDSYSSWEPGDTIHVVTRAVATSPNSNVAGWLGSPYILIKNVILQ